MFNGIVETVGIIQTISSVDDCRQLTITPKQTFDDLVIGDSMSVNGVCLTMTDIIADSFVVSVVPETLRVTNFNSVQQGQFVNLERSLKLSSRIGGHFLQGHVDGVGEIIELTPDGKGALLVKIQIPKQLAKYMVNKGYIAIDGMSITIIESTHEWFTVTFIPHTQQVTTVNQYRVGTLVNIEVDILGKYIEKFLGGCAICNPI